MWGEEEEFGIFVRESNGPGSEKGKNSCYGENDVEGGVVEVSASEKRRRPMEKAVTSNMVGVALHINGETQGGQRGVRVFEMTIVKFTVVISSMEVGVVTSMPFVP